MVVITTSTFPLLLHLNTQLHDFHCQTIVSLNPYNTSITQNRGTIRRKRWRRNNRTVVLANSEPSTAAKNRYVDSQSVSPPSSSSNSTDSAANIVRKFYGGINRRDLSSVENLIADNCVYEDLVFPNPFVGRKAILNFFKEFMDSISKDLQFAIDDISEEDTEAVGVTWHLEWKGKPFPFSKGCSFYKLEDVNGQRQIVYGRDVVEPFIKPGDITLVAIRGVTWLLQKFPQLAERF